MTVARPFNPFIAGGAPFVPGQSMAPLFSPVPMAQQNIPMRPPGPMLPPPMMAPQPMGPTPMQSFGNPFQVPAMGAGSAPMGASPPSTGNRFADFLGSDAALAMAAGILEGGTTGQAIGRGFNYALQARNKSTATTDDLTEYAFAKQQGYAGTFADFLKEMKAAGATKNMGTVPPGYTVEYDAGGNPVRMVPIPGSPDDIKAQEAEAQREAEGASRARYGDVVLEEIGRAKELVKNNPGFTTGFGGSFGKLIPGSDATDLASLTDTIGSNIGFERLAQMRQESPTGGALGNVTERELQLLQSTLGSLNQSQSAEQFLYNLERLEKVYSEVARKAAAYPNAAKYGFAAPDDDGYTVEPLD